MPQKTGEDYYLSEFFFILKKYRRKGVGKQAVQQLWRRYPGKYLLGELHQNEAAIKFWTSLYEAYNLKYKDYRDEKLYYQSFEIKKSPAVKLDSVINLLLYDTGIYWSWSWVSSDVLGTAISLAGDVGCLSDTVAGGETGRVLLLLVEGLPVLPPE